MNKHKEIYSFDISKCVLDVYSNEKGHLQLKNDPKVFKRLLKNLPKTALVVIETSGIE